MGKKEKWCWSSALIGAASAIAASALISAKPKDPSFHLISISFKSFKPNLPIPDAEVLLNIHVSNPNIAPIKYSDSTMSIFYQDSLLGKAHLQGGSQPANSCQLVRLPARLNVLQFAQHAATFVSDVVKREMLLDATIDIGGTAKVLQWDQNFKIHVDSHITVDPMSLDVLDQENTPKLQLFTGSSCPNGDGKCMMH